MQEEFQRDAIRPVECYREGWQAIRGQYWILFAVSIVAGVIGGMSLYILLGAMICGVFYCFFQVIDGGGGERVELEGLFKGFKYFVPSFPVMFLIIAPLALVLFLVYLPFVFVLANANLSPDDLYAYVAGFLAIEFFVALLMVCLHTLLMFAFPLIVDRNLNARQAIKLSARAVLANLSGIVGLWLIGFLIAAAGLAVFCIGIYFATPVIIAGNVVAYRKVFPKRQKLIPET